MRADANQTQSLPLFDHFLRDYQKEAHAKLREDWRAGHRRLLIEMPTGTGKTRTFVLLPKEGARTLVIVPLIKLIGQTVKTIRTLRNCSADIEQAHLSATPETEFVVASWQTLISNDRWKKFLGKVDLVVVDEAHWGFTTAARDVLNALVDGGARVLGCTATAYRADRQALLGFYEKVSYCFSLRTAIDQGYLVPPKVKVHYVKSIDLGKLSKKSASDFAPEELDQILRSEEALQDLAALISQNHRQGAKGVVFAHSVRQATLLRDMLLDRFKVQCSLVHSYQSDAECSEEIHEFTDGSRELIINVGILTTGWDYPPLSEIFLAKPTKALSKYVQMVGRGTRSLEGVLDKATSVEERRAAIAASDKPHFIIHDITDSSRCHKLCSALDVLSSQSTDIKVKVRDSLKDEATVEEIDAAVAAEVEAEKETHRLHREAERRRRAGIVIGVEFGSEERDPFAEPDRDTARRREWRCPFGKQWKGQPMRIVDRGFISWALRSANLTPMWRKVFQDELNRRDMTGHVEVDSYDIPSRSANQKSLGFS